MKLGQWGARLALLAGILLLPVPGQAVTGVDWVTRIPGAISALNLNGAAWSGTQFVAVGATGTILTSPNGVTWTPQTSGTFTSFRSVVWGGTQFVAVGDAVFGPGIFTSPNGITWTARTSPMSVLNSVVWSGTQFVAVGGNNILTSPDGITWTARTVPVSVLLGVSYLNSVVWSGTQFVAVAGAPLLNSAILTSPDGITWTVRAAITGGLFGITWSGTQFVAVGGAFMGSAPILTSPDGIIWTTRVSGTNGSLYGVAWSGTQFVAVGIIGTILTSPDGITWTTRTPPVGTTKLNSVVWSGTQFVAVGDSGTILTSGSAASLALNAKAVPLGDVNGNLMPEVAALYHEAAGTHAIYIKDGLSGALIRKIVLGAAWTPLDLQVLPDLNANGKPELAVLLRHATTGAVVAQIVDSFTGLLIRNVAFTGNPWTPLALQVVPDVNANGQPELAVLLRNATTGAVQVQVKDTLTGLLVRNVAYTGNPLTPLALQVVPDLNANAKPELAVLQRNATTGAVQAQVMDAFTGLLVKTVAFTAWTPLDMQVAPDLNANGKSELAVLLRNPANGAVIGQVRDAFTGLLVKNVAFTGWAPLALRVVPDVNANGKPELAVLMRNPTTGAVLVQVSDAFSGLLVKNVAYGIGFSPRDLAVLPDTNANGKPDLAVLGANSATEAARVQIHDTLTGALLRNIAVP